MTLTAIPNNVASDQASTVKIEAYVTDALGNPVADNTAVSFIINDTPPLDPNFMNGSFSGAAPTDTASATTKGGYASVTYGWVNESAAGGKQVINASVTADPNVNATTTVFFNPTYASWFGSVVDSYGKPFGGVPVTLRVMGFTGLADMSVYEQYNVTVTASDMPYPGAYTFDNLIINSSTAYAYATAEATIQDNLTIRGMSNNYSMNKSKTSSGFIVLHVPLPDAIKLTPNPDTILVGGDTSEITAQLYLNGNPYKRSGVTVNFFSDNDSRAYLPAVKTNVTNALGQAKIILTSAQYKGDVNVTGYARITVASNLTDTCVVHVVGWGTISGMVTDKNKNGIPNATVKLWRTKFANDTYEATELWGPSPDNPQQTVSRPEVAAIGTYTYYRVPSGIYNLTAEKTDAAGNNHMWFAIVNLTVGTATNNVAIPDLVITVPVTPTPGPATATPVASPTPVPATPTPTPTPTPGFETVFALAGLLGVAYLIARKEH